MAENKTQKKSNKKNRSLVGTIALLTLTFLILFGVSFFFGYELGIYLVG
ncbi:hypothetical protein [Vallitalea okinawensis]|nr:hypothetical protein [Vallitalea okinawensis]